MNIGDMGVPFIYQGEELIYPEYVKDGLVLHYDFSGMTNNDASKDIARDLSGNGNHGTLQNFNFTPESGYDKNKLLFDGVDDRIRVNNPLSILSTKFTWTATITPIIDESGSVKVFMSGNSQYAYFRIILGRLSASLQGADRPINHTLTQYRLESGVTYHTCLVHDNGSYYIYANGEKVGESHDSLKGAEYSLNKLGEYTNAVPESFNGDFHSAMVYNRPLTAEEIAHNYAIEKERFGIE